MIEVVGTDNVVGGIDQVARNLEDMTPAMREINDALTAYHAGMYGKGRKDLPSTLVRHPDSDGRLTETGKLRASLTQPHADGAVRAAGPTGSVWGTSLWYAGFAAYGTPTEKRRPLVRFNTATKTIIRDIVDRWVWHSTEDASS
jgi:hypothetical protein